MANLEIKDTIQTKNNPVFSKQHQAVHGNMRYIVNAVGQLDLASCVPHIAESSSLSQRIALYRRSLHDLSKALQRDNELDKQSFSGRSSLEDILKENQMIQQYIGKTLELAENALKVERSREELNVLLVKINLAVNAICETINMKLVKEDALARLH